MPERAKIERKKETQYLIDDLWRKIDRKIEKNLREDLRGHKKFVEDQILRPFVEEIQKLEFYDPEKAKEILEKILNEAEEAVNIPPQPEQPQPEQQQQAKEAKIPSELFRSIREIFFTEGEKEVTLNEELDKTLEEFFRKEGKGKNFREEPDPEFLRGYLYLMLPEGELKNKFKPDFEKLVSAKEETFWFSFSPPFLKKEFKLKKGFEPGEFPGELKSRLEDLSKGKNRITLEFTEKDLPKEIKDELEGKNEGEKKAFLESLGIHQVGNKYETYITRDKLSEILEKYTEALAGTPISEARVQKQIDDIQKKLKEVKPLLGNYYGAYNILFAGLLEGIKGLRTRGGTEEEWKRIEEQLNKFSQGLDPIVQEKDKTKAQGKALNFLKGAGGFLKEAGFWAGMTVGIFGLMLFWFLPLWLIARMNKEIESFMKSK